jgi:hypothetical protein
MSAPASRRVIEAVQVDLPALHPRVHGLGPVHPALVRGLDRRELDPADETEDVAAREAARHHPGQVACILELEDEGRDVQLRAGSGGDDEDRFGILGRDALGRPLELEPVGEDQVVALGRIGPKRFVLVGRGAGFDVTDGEAEGVTDRQEAGVGPGIPGCVGHAARGDEPNPQTLVGCACTTPD